MIAFKAIFMQNQVIFEISWTLDKINASQQQPHQLTTTTATLETALWIYIESILFKQSAYF